MLPKRAFVIGALVVISGLTAACTPGSNLPVEGVVSSQPPTPTVSGTAQGQVVEETPMSEAELTAQPTGQTEPGAGTPGVGATNEPGTVESGTVEPGQPTAYVNDEFKFRVDYPNNYV